MDFLQYWTHFESFSQLVAKKKKHQKDITHTIIEKKNIYIF